MLPIRPLSRAEVRAIDVEAVDGLALPTLALMENAGRGAAALLRDRLAAGSRVVIACGPGNNGGDGGVVARHLDSWGFAVHVAWFCRADQLRGDAATQRAVVERSGIPCSTVDDPATLNALWAGADWVVDGLLGTGATRPLTGLMAAAVRSINGSGRPVLALDLPSGLDADTGVPLGGDPAGAIQASLTATFVAPKLGFARPGADRYTGAVTVVEIGVPRRILAPYLIA